MKLAAFTLRLDPTTGSFDDEALRTFCRDREVLAVQEHFFVFEQRPTWALLVSYRDLPRAGDPPEPADPRKDWREEVAEADRPLFDALRAWRNERARREGRPPYILLTNRQLAEVARRRPSTPAGLREIPGLGEAKTDLFGPELLALVARVPPHLPPASAGEDPEVAGGR